MSFSDSDLHTYICQLENITYLSADTLVGVYVCVCRFTACEWKDRNKGMSMN